MPWLRGLAQSLGGHRTAPEPDLAAEPTAAPPEAETAAIGLRILDDPYADRRSSPRHEAEVEGRLQLPTAELDCRILDLSTGGMSVEAPDAALISGMQVAVLAQSLPKLVGTVRWHAGGAFGVQFTRPLAAEVLEKMGQLKRRVRGPRASRALIELPCTVYFDDLRHPVTVGNISVGGAMMTDPNPAGRGQRRHIRQGQPLMIHFPELMPIGGHVRWTLGAKFGVMFSRLLPLPTAAEIQRIGNLSHAWLEDVRQAHAALDAARDTLPSGVG